MIALFRKSTDDSGKTSFAKKVLIVWIIPLLVSLMCLLAVYFIFEHPRVDHSKSPDASVRIWYENRLDLNLIILDAGRYKSGDNWFARRLEDIKSIRRISYNEAVGAYERLSTLDDEQFNDQLFKMAASSMSTKYSEYGDIINNFLLSLDKHQPASLSELARRIASSLKGKNVRSMLFRKLQINSWMLLLTAIEQNPETDTSGTFEAAFIDAFGGARDFGALLFFNHYKAIVNGDLDEALLSVKLAATANRIFPDILPQYVSLIAALDDKRVKELVMSFESFEDTDKVGLISSVIWGFPGRRSEGFEYFSSFAKREFDFSDDEFEELAHEILYLQLGSYN